MFVQLTTNFGTIKIQLEESLTPITVQNFLQTLQKGIYNGTIFHRVIDGFMIQGGGFDATMSQKSSLAPIQNEADKGIKNAIGTIAMARTSDPHSATNQFFINVADNKFLDHQNKTSSGWGYCAFGRVVEGLDVVQKIAKVKTTSKAGHQDVPVEPVMIESAVLLEETTATV